MSSSRAAAVILATTVFLGGQVWAQAPVRLGTPVAQDAAPDRFGLAPPTHDQVFRVQSEQDLKERIRKEMPNVKKIDFPEEATPLRGGGGTDLAALPEQVISPVPVQVCYRPLYFEDKQTERFGYYVPCLQPFLSAGRFYGDFLLLPYRICQTPPWTFECDNR